MNKWQLKYYCKYYATGEQGFALPAAIGIGLIVMLVGVTTIVRSQADRSTAIAQKATADSLGVSEAGVTRILALLKKYPVLLPSHRKNRQSRSTIHHSPSTIHPFPRCLILGWEGSSKTICHHLAC